MNIKVETVPVERVHDEFMKYCSSHYGCGGCKYYNQSRPSKYKDMSCDMLFVRDKYYLVKKGRYT